MIFIILVVITIVLLQTGLVTGAFYLASIAAVILLLPVLLGDKLTHKLFGWMDKKPKLKLFLGIGAKKPFK